MFHKTILIHLPNTQIKHPAVAASLEQWISEQNIFLIIFPATLKQKHFPKPTHRTNFGIDENESQQIRDKTN
jgi:hypothetical protein